MIKCKVHTIRCGEVSLIEEDILHVKYFKGVRLVVQDILDVQGVRLQLIGKKAFYNLMDGSAGNLTASNEARAWMSINKESAQVRIMDIMLVSGWSMKLKVSAYLKLLACF